MAKMWNKPWCTILESRTAMLQDLWDCRDDTHESVQEAKKRQREAEFSLAWQDGTGAGWQTKRRHMKATSTKQMFSQLLNKEWPEWPCGSVNFRRNLLKQPSEAPDP